MRDNLDAFKAIKKGTIESIDYLAGLPDMRQVLIEQLKDIESNRGHYATGECYMNDCGYPRIWFGRCMAQYRDSVARKRLKEIFS